LAALEKLFFNNTFYELGAAFYTALKPQPIKNPYLVSASEKVAELLGLNKEELKNKSFVEYFSGQKLLPGSQPLAMVYSGHQFGSYNPRLGDGRAMLLGEVEGPHGRYDLVIKGAGMTPYSRFGDGRAVLRSSIREYLCSEAMAGLGIPTTRALCVIGGEDQIAREILEPSAVILRVSESHIRFGSFEWFYYQNDHASLKKLADYVIEHHFSDIKDHKNKYALFYAEVVRRTAWMIAKWQAVGFAHGVMNTDNMSILGQTFDYGPYGFLDDFEPGFICNHSDDSGRYAFNRQPEIGLWNLNALAHALTPLIDKSVLIDILKDYERLFVDEYVRLFSAKLGLIRVQEGDDTLIQGWLELMAMEKVDYNNCMRNLCDTNLASSTVPVKNYFRDVNAFDGWFLQYRSRLEKQNIADSDRQKNMKRVNPKFILRNYLAQRAIEQAQNQRDFSEVNALLNLLYTPFDEHNDMETYAAAPPESGKHLEISCSS
jgi:serine/tyrosine/threonine adenylyltransferase